MEASRQLCEQAQSCFSFVDREGFADSTADVYAAVRATGGGWCCVDRGNRLLLKKVGT